eukprot:2432978-Rhodomonas_salina.1
MSATRHREGTNEVDTDRSPGEFGDRERTGRTWGRVVALFVRRATLARDTVRVHGSVHLFRTSVGGDWRVVGFGEEGRAEGGRYYYAFSLFSGPY